MKYFLALAALTGVATAQAGAWGQCGGQGWNGATTCISGYVCTVSNQWYSQCLPGSSPPPAATTLVTQTTSTVKPTTTATPPPTSGGGWKWFGVNEAGGEFGEKVLPGTWGKEFIFPDPATITVSTLGTLLLPALMC